MAFNLKLLLVFGAFIFQMNTLKSQIDMDDFSLVMIGNNTSLDMITKAEMKQFFNGKYYSWPNSQNVVVVLPSSKHSRVELYSNMIYNKSFYSVKKHWYSLVFQGRYNPPYFFDSDQKIIDFVKNNKGSFAIVKDCELIPDELRIAIKNKG
jgi:hypothetical protein